MKKLSFCLALTAVFLVFAAVQPATAGKVEALVDKLVEKGVLTRPEADALMTEMEKEKDEQKAEVEKMAKEAVKKEAKSLKIPTWVSKIKPKGDFRFRYESKNRDNDGNPRRDRWRMRWRLGLVADVTEQWEAGFGLASGSADPRSTNQTLDDTFSSPDVRLDYAYAKYTPLDWLTAFGGKFKNPLWRPKDLLWDSDIRPEGIAVPLSFQATPDVDVFVTPAYFILDEFSSTTSDPYLLLLQGGVKWKVNDPMALKLAATYYGFDNLKGNSFTYSSGSNTTDGSGNLLHDYESFVLDAELGYKLDTIVPYFAVFGQYVSADSNDDDMGWLLGAKLGDKKVKEFGQWQFKYNYRRLERDAWPDFLPDSDFYGGETNAKGHEFEGVFGLAKNVTFGIDHYRTQKVSGPEDEEYLWQFDLLLKW